jgi:beta-glucosidase
MALQAKGAWENPDSPRWFSDYVQLIARRYGDRVKDFFTLNEPQCFVGLGYTTGEHAPGLRLPLDATIQMSHHALTAHGLAVQALRASVPEARVGYAPCSTPACPVSESPEDIEAARQATFRMPQDPARWFWNVSWWSDPAILGHYPEDGLKRYGRYLPKGYEKDLPVICQKLDYYAQNIYNGFFVRAGADGPEIVPPPRGAAKTGIGWPVTPECLYWGPKFLCERYHLPLIIAENGMSDLDALSLDGKVHDPARINYLHRYLRQLLRAAGEGVPVAGYFHWSFLDNFEWAKGYDDRFGLVYVDYETQERLPKDSAVWFKAAMEANGENL